MKISHIVHKIHSFKKEKCEKKKMTIGLVVVLVLVAVLGFLTNWNYFIGSTLSKEDAKLKTEQFIISSNLAGGRKVEIREITSDGSGLYKIMVQLEGAPNTIESYVTKDGKLFFPNVMKMTPEEEVSIDIPKSDKPTVELFVMSYCPYGTQIEKGIIPVLETLGSSIDFKLKFVNYILHGKKEFDENTRQYCIEKEAPEKLVGYLKCFNGENSGTCLAQNSISSAAVNSCISKTDTQYKLTALFNKESKAGQGNPTYPIHESENRKYEVKGSPALVINGKSVDAKRDSASLLKTICSAFSDAPDQCDAKLSDVAPGPGFGDTPAAASNAPSAGCAQ